LSVCLGVCGMQGREAGGHRKEERKRDKACALARKSQTERKRESERVRQGKSVRIK